MNMAIQRENSQGPLNRWMLQLDFENTTGGLKIVVSVGLAFQINYTQPDFL